jgi:hypothetical protein
MMMLASVTVKLMCVCVYLCVCVCVWNSGGMIFGEETKMPGETSVQLLLNLQHGICLKTEPGPECSETGH